MRYANRIAYLEAQIENQKKEIAELENSKKKLALENGYLKEINEMLCKRVDSIVESQQSDHSKLLAKMSSLDNLRLKYKICIDDMMKEREEYRNKFDNMVKNFAEKCNIKEFG